MKKLLSVLSMALIAGGLLFTSCGKNFTITVNSNDAAYGTVTGGGSYAEGAEVVLKATPNASYTFVRWNDGVTENPRTITVTANETYTAFFYADPAVNVTFNSSAWNASDIKGNMFEGNVWDVYSSKTSGEFPIADVCLTTTATGSYSGNVITSGENTGDLDNDKISWIEYYNEAYLQDQDQNYYGDFWAKQANVSITAFDATALILSSNVNATMFSAYEAFTEGGGLVGVDAATTAPMTVSMSDVRLTSAKSTLRPKYNGKKLVANK